MINFYDSELVKLYMILELRLAKGIYFNPPYTTIKWQNGTATTVKCTETDSYSEEAGIALCLMKYITGNSFHKRMKECINKAVDVPAQKIKKQIKKQKKNIKEVISEIKEQ